MNVNGCCEKTYTFHYSCCISNTNIVHIDELYHIYYIIIGQIVQWMRFIWMPLAIDIVLRLAIMSCWWKCVYICYIDTTTPMRRNVEIIIIIVIQRANVCHLCRFKKYRLCAWTRPITQIDTFDCQREHVWSTILFKRSWL